MSEKRISPTISKISMLIAAILMGNVGLLISLFTHFPTYTIVLLRGMSGTFFLTLIMLYFHAFSKNFLKEIFKTHWKSLLIIGIANPIILYLYFENIFLTGYGVAAFLLYTCGIFALLFLIITKIDKITKLSILSFIIAIIGVGIIMEFWTGQMLNFGMVLGILSGLILGIQIFYLKKIYLDRGKGSNNFKTNGELDIFLAWWPTLFIILLFLPLGAIDLLKITPIEIVWVLILGALPTALAFTLYNVGLKNDKGGNIIILSYFEPVVATINSVIFLHQFSIYTVIGGGLILVANIIILIFSKTKTVVKQYMGSMSGKIEVK